MKKSISPKKEELEALFLNFQARLDELKISHHEILKVSGPLENQRGGESRVFAAEIARGPVAVRVDFAQVIRDRAAAIILQDYFGRFGATPILLGILEGEELKQLMAGHAEFADIRSPWPEMPKAPPFSAIVMEVVEDGWNILQPERSREHPPHLGVWDNAKILKQVGEIQNLATRLDVQIVDPQFLVSRKGEVKIIDLDHWFFIDSKENYWAYDGKAPERLVEWVDKQNIRNDFSTQVAQALQLLARHCEA